MRLANSGNEIVHDMSMHIGQTEITSIIAIGEPFVIESQLVKEGGVQVVHMHLVLHGVVSEFIGGAVTESGFEAATGQPHGETARVVVASGAIVFRIGSAAKFTAPPDDGILEQSTGLEVCQQCGDRLIDGSRMFGVFRHVAVLIPCRGG